MVSENQSTPSCYHSEPSEYGYNVYNASLEANTVLFSREFTEGEDIYTKEVTSFSYRLGNSEKMTVTMKFLQSKTPYGGEMWPAVMTVERGDNDIIRLTLSSPGHEEGTLIKDPTFSSSPATDPKLDVEITQIEDEAFNVTIFRFNNKEDMLFRTIFGPFIIGDGYIEFTSTIPSKYIQGLGSRFSESQNPLFDEFDEWSLNSRDPSYSNTSLPDTHPFYMSTEPSTGDVHGVYLRTSTPLQIGTVPAPGLSFRALLGTFKILVLAGPTPKDVSDQITSMLGKPSLPPFWALGFHMCRTVEKANESSAFRYTIKRQIMICISVYI